MYRQAEWLQIKLEEDSRDTITVGQCTRIVCYAVLVRAQRLGAWCDIRRRNDVHMILIRNKGWW